mmetsp:Transcript_52357/g.86771  ORF Transcript_52357/g.86771 Transcript_52357/m.86771 type:complete len:522 (+) Transcript_52357:83-1648(+)
MQRFIVPFSVLLVCLAQAWAQDDTTECSSQATGTVDVSLLQKGKLTQRLDQHEDMEAGPDTVKVGPYGVDKIPYSLLNRMVLSNPYKCEFLAGDNDFRAPSCDKSIVEAGLHPSHFTAEGNASADHVNILRLYLPIGALPCCATAPFCSAPSCTPQSAMLLKSTQSSDAKICTKRSAAFNYAYMTHPEVWPAYYGTGGSYEIDVQKHWDVLGRLNGLRPHDPPFDLFIDLGANSGFFTEKVVMRRFAKDYLMVEAAPQLRETFDARLGNLKWRNRFLKQAATWENASSYKPDFEFKTFALSDRSGGYLDICSFNWSWAPPVNCKSEKASVDTIVSSKLSRNFAAKVKKAQSAYVKVDTEGMDQMALLGMRKLLQEKRGKDFLVNFMMFEFCAACMEKVRQIHDLKSYDLKTFAKTLESLGFEAFLMGPRYLPLTHGSWADAFVKFSKDPENKMCQARQYPKIKDAWPEWCEEEQGPDGTLFAGDIFAIRAGHPKAAEIKLALGACKESTDFNLKDAQYNVD